MYLTVHPDALALGLRHVRVWRVTSRRSLLSGAGPSVAELAGAPDSYHRAPAGYRRLFAALGYAGTVPAGERLRELAATRGLRSHGLIVDVVSAATLIHGGGIGLHRMAEEDEQGEFVVTRATGTERVTPAFSGRSRAVPEGDLIYGIQHTDRRFQPCAWLGRRDCDAAGRQLTEDCREALLVALGCPGEEADHTESIGATVAQLLAEYRPDVHLSPLRPRKPSLTGHQNN